jgi:MFS superfamily sulfate permease-like transporter
LANPREFVSTYRIGSEQLVVFLGTIVATLATDLLIGIAVGIGIKLAFHLWNGAPLSGIFKSDIEIAYDDDEMPVLNVRRAAVFSNWLGLKRAIVKTAADHDMITLDMSNTRLVDHSVMEKLHELQHEFETQDKRLVIVGLDNHQPLSSHPQAARKFRPNDQVIEV